MARELAYVWNGVIHYHEGGFTGTAAACDAYLKERTAKDRRGQSVREQIQTRRMRLP